MDATAVDTPQPAPQGRPEGASTPFREMRLQVGDRLHLEPPTQCGLGRLVVNVVGWVQGSSFIVTAPRSGSGRLDLQPGELVSLRAFTGCSAFSFRCTVLKRSAPPFEYLHLSFPVEVNAQAVRKAPRLRTDLPAKAAPDGAAAVELVVRNLSTTGALLATRQPLGAAGAMLRLDLALLVQEAAVPLSLACVIRSAKEGKDAAGAPLHAVGVAFEDLAPNALLALSAYIWSRMYEDPRLAA